MSTLPLFDHPAVVQNRRQDDVLSPGATARRVRDEALTRVTRHAASGFLSDALTAIRRVASQRESFTTDEVIPELSVATHDLRALGAAMRKAQEEKLIQPTDRFRNTNRVSRHHAPIRVWASLICKGETR